MKIPLAHFLFVIALALTTYIHAAEYPGKAWPTATPTELGLDESKLIQARDYALTGEGSGCIIYHGKLVLQWGDQTALYDLKSSSKAIGVTALGLALKDGLVQLDDPAKKFHPTFGTPPESNAQTGWLDQITLRHLATQTAGFEKPGGYEKLDFAPGTAWLYSDGGPNWLAECLTLAYHRDLNDVLFERVFTPIGITSADLKWRKHAYRPEFIDGLPRREFGSGFSANVPAMARLGYLYLREGWWNGELLLTHSFIQTVRTTSPEVNKLPVHDPQLHGNAVQHYGLLWWNNNDGTLTGLPRDAYWSWGLFDSFILVVPSLDLVVARAGKSWARTPGEDHYAPLKPFFEPIVGAMKTSTGSINTVRLPLSPLIARIRWAPIETILRRAKGSDNWPLTWADDDAMYTAYGDGNGFEPFVPAKLSMGFAKVVGAPDSPQGTNLPSSTFDTLGDGKKGRKASGILMVDGTLYLLARNLGNAQLGWSTDHGATWTWADWKFTESFGCPTFLNFGKNYAGARDQYVYIASPDAETAYQRADRVVLARVPKDKVRDHSAYEYLEKLEDDGQPKWSADIRQRGGMAGTGQCYRLGFTYDAGLKRYLLCMTGAGNDPRFAGGFGIYDAPEPWGPWTTAFHTDEWDTGPGESSSLPTKWMSADGLTVHLVFSGNDSFCVRRGEIVLRAEGK